MTQVIAGTVRLTTSDYVVTSTSQAAKGPEAKTQIASSIDAARQDQLSTLEQVVEYLKVLYR